MTMPTSPRRLSAEVRAEIKASTESVRALAQRLGINPKSVQRWRRRNARREQRSERSGAGSSVLTPEEEAIAIAFRQTTQLALDDCLYALQPTIPHLRRSTLHRCLQRHGLSTLRSRAFPPEFDAGRGEATGLGQIAIVISPAPTEEGVFHLFGATDRLTRFAYARLYASDDAEAALAFLAALTAALPYRLDAILTDDSPAFAWASQDDQGPAPEARHPFAAACRLENITHVAAPRAPSVRTASAPRQRFKYRSRQELQGRLADFLCAVNYGQRLKVLGGSRLSID
jgi:transposase-like protein